MSNQPNQPDFDPAQRKRLLLALVLSAVVLFGFDFVASRFFGHSFMGGMSAAVAKPAAESAAAPVAGVAALPGMVAGGDGAVPVAASTLRMKLENKDMEAQVALTGARLDTLTLKEHSRELKDGKGFDLLKPAGTYAEYVAGGWQGSGIEGPGENTPWQAEADVNGDGKPLLLVWRNSTGQSFQREMKLTPQSHVIEVTDRVVNGAALPVTFSPYVQVHRADGYWPNERSSWVNYFGPMGVVQEGENLITHERKYATLKKDGSGEPVQGTGGWWGITNQYFMTAIIPLTLNGKEVPSERLFGHSMVGAQDFYSAGVRWPGVVVPSGGSAELTYQIYAGPKHDAELQAAGHGMERAIDWGWFKMIAKPLYHALVFFYDHLGNWALAVIALTFALKLATLPLANKSYHAMAKIRKLQPRLQALKERHGGDQQALAMATMQLYKEEKVNPLSGCWPMLIQIPIFFAMYKVVLVAFEFRHAPLALWIHDMSAADPYFVLPVLMGISMFVQFKLNPAPTDPTQAMMFKWMPVFMTVMFLWFPSGLVLYWLTNNMFSIAQQWIIMRGDKAI